MAVAISCGYGGYLLPLLAAHSSYNWDVVRVDMMTCGQKAVCVTTLPFQCLCP